MHNMHGGWCYVVVADKNGPKDYDDVEGWHEGSTG